MTTARGSTHPGESRTYSTAKLERVEELALLNALLTTPEVRIVTIVGQPGVGKSALAKQLAEWLEYVNGISVITIDLRSYGHSELNCELIDILIARSLGLPAHSRPYLEDYSGPNSGTSLILDIDNCEYPDLVRDSVERLQESYQDVKLLITSLLPIGIVGERIFELNPVSEIVFESLIDSSSADDRTNLGFHDISPGGHRDVILYGNPGDTLPDPSIAVGLSGGNLLALKLLSCVPRVH